MQFVLDIPEAPKHSVSVISNIRNNFGLVGSESENHLPGDRGSPDVPDPSGNAVVLDKAVLIGPFSENGFSIISNRLELVFYDEFFAARRGENEGDWEVLINPGLEFILIGEIGAFSNHQSDPRQLTIEVLVLVLRAVRATGFEVGVISYLLMVNTLESD